MRILFVIPDVAPSSGGSLSAVFGLAEALFARGVEVSLATTDFGLDGLPSIDGVHVRLFPCRWPQARRWAPGLLGYLYDKAGRYDLVSVHTIWQYPVFAAGLACRRARVPYLLTPHGMLDTWSLGQRARRKQLYLWLCERATLGGAAAIQMTSEGEWRGSRPERWNPSVFVLPWGVRREAWMDMTDTASFGERFPALQGKRPVLFLGRLDSKKQPEVVLYAFQRICVSYPETCLVLAGPGLPSYVAILKRLARELGIAERVVFTGLLQGPAVQEAYRAAALFVLPSWQENFGFTVVEAMAAGCPVIVSDQMDLAGDVENAGAGLVVTPTVEATAEAMDRLLVDEALRIRMGKSGRRFVLAHFTWERVVEEFLQVCNDILTGRRTSYAWRITDRNR